MSERERRVEQRGKGQGGRDRRESQGDGGREGERNSGREGDSEKKGRKGAWLGLPIGSCDKWLGVNAPTTARRRALHAH